MRLIALVLAVAAAPAAAVQVMPLAATSTSSALVQKLGDETVCGLPSFPRRRACYVRFGDFSAWIYFGRDARTLESLSLAWRYGGKDKRGASLSTSWVDVDAQGRVTKAVAHDYDEKRAGPFEQALTEAQAVRQVELALAAFEAAPVTEKRERYCSEAGDYEDHMMGCCDGLQEVRVSNDAYKCAAPGQPVEIEPEYHSWRPDR